MAETRTESIELALNREQRSQWYGHIMTYAYNLTLTPNAPRNKAQMNLLQGVGIRLFGMWEDTSEAAALSLTAEEVQALSEMLTALETVYGQWPGLESSSLAQAHVEACRRLLEEAERQMRADTPGQEGEITR